MADGDPKDKKSATPVYAPLTPAEKLQWNQYIDFMQKQGMKGNPALDNKDQKLGEFYFNRFKTSTPGITLTYQDVPRVQSDLQGYRNTLIDQWHKGKIVPDESVKTDEDLMPGISKVDGWLGSKTSSYKFPTAVVTTPAGTVNYGVNTEAFDKDRLATKK